jgi:hypothetical protein
MVCLRRRRTGVRESTPELEPAFKVDYSCSNVINEFNNYRAPGSSQGRNVPEVGQKAKDHAMDAIRYGLMHKFRLGATSHLSDIYAPRESIAVSGSASLPAASVSPPVFEPHASSELHQGPSDAGYFTMESVF